MGPSVPHRPDTGDEIQHDSMRLQMLRLDQICGVHPLVDHIRNESGGYMRDLPHGGITPQGLIEIANYAPLHVALKDGQFKCVGGQRLFRLLQFCDGSTLVPVLAHSKLPRKALTDLIRLDLLLIPVFFSLQTKDIRRLGTTWAQQADTDFFFRVIASPGSEALANLVGCDVRTVTERKRTSHNASVVDLEGKQILPKAAEGLHED